MAATATPRAVKLCRSCGGSNRWYPAPVAHLDSFFGPYIKKTTNVPNGYAVRKNLCYALQYLEYLAECLDQLSLSDVLVTMTYKQFVVTGMGIIEAILYYLLRERRLMPTSEWELLGESVGPPIAAGSVALRADLRLMRKRAVPIEEEPKFERILRTAERKKVLGSNAKFFADAHHLRKLRNRVHLYATSHDLDSDWNAFGFKELELVKASLLKLVSGQPFAATGSRLALFEFLLPWKSVGERTI